MSDGLVLALACAVFAIIYGLVSIKWVLAKPTGNERMREIAAAIQEGAQAYLNRQYRTIGMVGVVLFVLHFYLPRQTHCGRFCARRDTLRRGRLYRHEYLGACQRAYRRSRA